MNSEVAGNFNSAVNLKQKVDVNLVREKFRNFNGSIGSHCLVLGCRTFLFEPRLRKTLVYLEGPKTPGN